MPTPPSPILRAASRWLEHLQTSSFGRTRALFMSHTAFRDITPTQYTRAYEWLQEHGLLPPSRSSPDLVKSEVFRAAIREAVWFTETDDLISGPVDLPEDAL